MKMLKKYTDSSAPDHCCYIEVVLILSLHNLTSYGFWILKSKSLVIIEKQKSDAYRGTHKGYKGRAAGGLICHCTSQF